MKIKDIIALIDPNQESLGARYDSPVSNDGDIQEWATLTGFDPDQFEGWSNEFGCRMLKHAVYSWVCTDTVVGVHVYCLDKKPVAISFQRARKSGKEILFINEEAYLYTKQVVETFMIDVPEEIEYADLEEEVDPSWAESAFGKWSVNLGKQK